MDSFLTGDFKHGEPIPDADWIGFLDIESERYYVRHHDPQAIADQIRLTNVALIPRSVAIGAISDRQECQAKLEVLPGVQSSIPLSVLFENESEVFDRKIEKSIRKYVMGGGDVQFRLLKKTMPVSSNMRTIRESTKVLEINIVGFTFALPWVEVSEYQDALKDGFIFFARSAAGSHFSSDGLRLAIKASMCIYPSGLISTIFSPPEGSGSYDPAKRPN